MKLNLAVKSDKMTPKEIKNWISWAENEISEYKKFIKDFKKRLKRK